MTAQSGLNERTRRRWAAVEARALGRGGIARVAEATGLSRTTIGAGLRELAEGREDEDASGRLRNPGAGRKSLPVHDAGLVALEKLVDPATRGDPMGPLRWTCSRSPGAEPPSAPPRPTPQIGVACGHRPSSECEPRRTRRNVPASGFW